MDKGIDGQKGLMDRGTSGKIDVWADKQVDIERDRQQQTDTCTDGQIVR